MDTSSINDLKEALKKSGIRPSIQRLKILEYLQNHHRSHPTAEEIYESLFPEVPTLSRATVYNTLHSFVQSGLTNCLSIDGLETHYDMLLEPHGHFKCIHCGKITNFPIDMDSIKLSGLKNYRIDHKDIIFTGICPDCNEK
jgi:Fe2+ or Zn2+ uptake regulation protein